MRAPPAQAPPRFSRTGTRGQEPVAGAFAGDRYPGRVPKGAACEVTLLRAARAASPRTSFIISISSPPRASAAALALPLSRADAHLVAVHAAAAAAAAAAAPTDDACGNVHARPRHCTRCVRRHGARHSLFRSPLPLARTRRRSLACSRARRRRRWGWGWRSVTPRVTRVTRVTRVRRACTSPPRIARVITVPLPPTRPHARAATAAALARSIARAVCGGCGGGGGGGWRWRAVTSPVTRVTRAARHARVRVRHHCASRASSPFSVSPRTTGTRALLRRRRSLARSRARRRRRWGWGWRSVTPRVTRGTHVTRVTRAREHAIAAHRARHHRSSSPHAPTRARCDGSGARSLDSARGVWRLRWRRWRAVEVAGGYIARHARYARRASRACMRTSSPRIARVITIFRPPRARPARARCCGGGARSLARARGGGGGGVGGGVQLHRASRASRARVCTSSPRIARVITAPLPRCHPCARAAAAAALSRLLACSRARRRRRTVIRTSCVSRASRARARASSSSRHLLAPLPP